MDRTIRDIMKQPLHPLDIRKEELPFELQHPEVPEPLVCFIQIGDVRLDFAGYAGFNVDLKGLDRGGTPTVHVGFFPANPDQLKANSEKLLAMVRTEWNTEIARLATL